MNNLAARHAETIRLYESGLSLESVGKILGVTHVGIHRRLVVSGVERRSHGKRKPMADLALAYAPGSTLVRAAGDVGLTRVEALGRIYYRQFSRKEWFKVQPFSDEEKHLIREAFDVDGLDFPDVIELINDHRSMEA